MTTVTQVLAFIPTDRQLALRLQVQRYVAPSVLAKLSFHTLDQLGKVLSPERVEEIRGYLRVSPEFLDWLTAPDDFDVQVQKLRMGALMTVAEIMERDDENNPGIMNAKIKAAEVILKQAMPQPLKSVQNLHISAMPNIPKAIASRSEEELEQELAMLQAQNKE